MNEKKNSSAAITIDNCQDVYLQANVAYGYDALASFSNSSRITAIENVSYSKEVINIFDRIESELNDQKHHLTREDLERANHSFNHMKDNYGQAGFLEKYKNFISSLSDHATVATALYPLLATLLHLS